jgi:hypothetical protein
MQHPSLALHRLLFRAALAAGNVFAWVIVFRLFYVSDRELANGLEYALAGTAALYALSHALTFILTPLAGMSLRRGIRKALLFGTVLASLSFALIAILFLADPSSDEVFWTAATFALVQGFYRAFYFVPYKTLEGGEHLTSILREAAIALMPAFAGFVLTAFADGAFILFASCAALALLSALSVARMPETYEAFDWSYGETLREFLARRNHVAVGLFILDGVQGAVLLFIWPLAVFLLLGSLRSLGAVLTATLCVAYLGRFVVKKTLRSLRARSPLLLASIVFSTWMVKLAAASPVQVLMVNVAYTSGASPARFSIDAHSSEQRADGGHFIDEYTAVKEMGLSLGRIAACVLFIVLLITTVESLAFAALIVTAAVSAAWSVLLAHRLHKAIY